MRAGDLLPVANSQTRPDSAIRVPVDATLINCPMTLNMSMSNANYMKVGSERLPVIEHITLALSCLWKTLLHKAFAKSIDPSLQTGARLDMI